LLTFIAAPIKRGYFLPRGDFTDMIKHMKKEDKQKGTGDNEGIVFEKDPSSNPTDLDTDQDDLDANLDDSVVAEEGAADTIKKLREKLKKSEAERQEYLTGWQRAKADLINARKRDEADHKEFIKFANERLIDGLIPVLDSFELAMRNKEAWEKADKNWRIGVESIANQLKKALTDAGLEEVNPVGQKFDPMRDEAASYEPVDSEDKNHVIIGVVQKGYTLNGRPMRPAKVKVGEFKA
jgi:molecular chaperone GrpE